MKRTMLFGVLVALLLVAGGAWAMESANFGLSWFTPMTSSGGGDADSAGYAVNLTVGQSVIGMASSDNYAVCLGYWCAGASSGGGPGGYNIYLPLALRTT